MIIKKLLRHTKSLNGGLLLSILSAVTCSIGQLALLAISLHYLAMGKTIDLVQTLFWLAGLGLLIGISRFGEQYTGHFVAFKILADFRVKLYRQLVRLAPTKLDDQHSSQLLKTITQDINATEVFYAHTITPVVTAVIMLVVQATLFWQFNPLLGAAAGFAYLIVGVLLPLVTKSAITRVSRTTATKDQANQQQVYEVAANQLIIQEHGLIEQAVEKVATTNAAYTTESRQKTLLQKQQTVLVNLIMAALTLVFGLIVLQLHQPVWLAILLPFTFERFLALAKLPGSLTSGLSAAQRLFNLLEESPAVTDSGKAGFPKAAKLPEVNADHITFYYPMRPDVPILSNLTLNIQSAHFVGITGKSGIGKSTILKLLMRWYDPNNGQLKISDVPTTDASLTKIRQAINYMAQEPVILTGSVRDNLVMGSQATDEQINDLLSAVRLKQRVQQLPKQLATQISAKHNPFSSGESQRIELVRALLTPSKILLLDEPTSNLDAVNEAIILSTVKNYYHGLVIMVTHRKSSLAVCDQVLTL